MNNKNSVRYIAVCTVKEEQSRERVEHPDCPVEEMVFKPAGLGLF